MNASLVLVKMEQNVTNLSKAGFHVIVDVVLQVNNTFDLFCHYLILPTTVSLEWQTVPCLKRATVGHKT